MRRMVTKPTTLSNGLALKPGDRTLIDTRSAMMDPTTYENPEVFDPCRFVRWRSEPGKENLAHLVSTSPLHLGFGHGEHACPGRFFAANEVKVVMCHLLLKYDWKLAPETQTNPIAHGMTYMSNPFAQVMFRRRKDTDLDIDSI